VNKKRRKRIYSKEREKIVCEIRRNDLLTRLLFSFVIPAAVADDDAIAVVCSTIQNFLSHVNFSDIIKEIVIPACVRLA
jgi:hypothetical protein